MRIRFKKRHLIWVVGIGILFQFQNCAPNLPSEDSFIQSVEDATPFAWNATLDTIAYMSCSNVPSGYDANSFFTFRAGAFNAGSGLSLTPAFLNYTAAYTPDLRAQSFSQSLNNEGTNLQLAIRQLGQYQNVLSGNGTAVTPGEDTNTFLAELDVNPMASQLGQLASNQWQNLFQGNSQTQFGPNSPNMVTSLTFFESETTATSVRSKLSDNAAYLTVTFTGTAAASDISAKGPTGTTQNYVWGTGYALSFGTPTGWEQSDMRVMVGANAYDISGTNALAPETWVCPSATLVSGETPTTLEEDNAQFMIIQPTDIAGVPGGQEIVCNEGPDPDPSQLNAPDRQILAALRHVLPVGDWYIDMENRCLIQTGNAATSSCYGQLNGQAIDYTSGACTPFGQVAPLTIGDCPHWVSLCFRTQ